MFCPKCKKDISDTIFVEVEEWNESSPVTTNLFCKDCNINIAVVEEAKENE
jgi:hypothetical protein